MTQKTSLTAASLLACLLILFAGIVLANTALAGDGDEGEAVVHEYHKIKLRLGDDMEMIEIDDLKPGESRQFFTDEGKEIVVTRGDEGIDVTVDGEEVDLPKMIHLETLTEDIRGGENGEPHKVIVRTGHGGGDDAAVWITSDEGGETEVEIEHLGEGGHQMHWVRGDGADIQIHRRSAAEFLKEKGVLEGLDEAERQAILDALKEFDSERAERKVIFIGKGDSVE